MKTKTIFAIVSSIAVLAYSNIAYGITTEKPASKVDLQFVESKKFNDIDLGYISHEKNEKTVLESVTKAFQKSADRYLPSGYKLEVQVTNIDLAGDRSPMSSTYGDFRVYRDIYPPRIHFSYSVYDAQENLVTSGTARESDLSYLNTIRSTKRISDKETPYIAEIVKRWASRSLKGL